MTYCIKTKISFFNKKYDMIFNKSNKVRFLELIMIEKIDNEILEIGTSS